MPTWWTRQPEVLTKELSALDDLGFAWAVDEGAKLQGRLVVSVKHTVDGTVVDLRVEYPDSYPYFQPQVYAPALQLPRHQHPVGSNLCLLARDGDDWIPGQDTVAALIKEQLPKVLKISSGDLTDEQIAEAEDHVGEPLSNFLGGLTGAVMVPDQTPPAEKKSGRLRLLVKDKNGGNRTAYIVTEVTDGQNKPFVRMAAFPPAFSQDVRGYWVRLEERPEINGKEPHKQFLQLFRAVSNSLDIAVNSAARGKTIIAGLVFKDEVSWRVNRDDWVFLAIRIRHEKRGKRSPETSRFFLSTDWAGEESWLQRAPSLKGLRQKSVLVVGAGTLGSVVATQLAKSGIRRLELVDFDRLQVGNTIRWALGWQFAGTDKVEALKDYITTSYPYTTVEAHKFRIGLPSHPPEPNEYNRIRALYESADLVIDATASYRVSHFLADIAWTMGKPYLWLTTTPGGAGGVVGRVVPEAGSGCWHCFQHALTDGSIPSPSDLGEPLMQPGGCSQPTFIGAGLDSDEIAVLASRLATATLCRGNQGGYVDFDWNVAVCDLKEAGLSLAPSWQTYPLGKHPNCLACAGT